MSDDYTAVLLEDINHKFDILLENMSFLATKHQVSAIDKRLRRVETDVKIIKTVVSDQSHQLHSHEKRITKLEKVM